MDQAPPLHLVDQNILDTARYFVTLHLGRRETALVAAAPPPRRVQMQEVREDISPLLRRMTPAARARLFRGRAPRVKKPFIVGDAGNAQAATLGAKPLVAMRVLRSRR